jgi:hypothetical protein
MFLNKAKLGVAVALLLGLLGSAVGLIPSYGQAKQQLPKPVPKGETLRGAQEPEARPKAKAERPKGKDAILKARVVAAERVYKAVFEGLGRFQRTGNTLVQVTQNPEEVHLWSVRWLQAERALKPKPEDQTAALQEHLERMTKLKGAIDQLTSDLMHSYNKDKAEWYLLEAELWLEEAKAAK